METPLHLAIGLGLLFQHVDLSDSVRMGQGEQAAHRVKNVAKFTLLHSFLAILMYLVGRIIQVFKEFLKFQNHLAWYFQGHIQHPKDDVAIPDVF